MGDRTTVFIRFSGMCSAKDAKQLIECLEEDYVAYSHPEYTQDLKIEHLVDVFELDEVNYASPDTLTNLAKEIGVSYAMWWHSGSGYTAGIQIYFAVPGETIECGSSEAGEATISASGLEKFDALEDAVKWLKLFDATEETLPQLKII